VTEDSRDIRRLIRRILAGAAGALVAGGVLVLAGGGVTLSLGGVPIRIHSPWRLFIPGLGAAGAAFALSGRAGLRADLERAWRARTRWAAWMAGAAAVATLIAGLSLGTWTAGSADSYGYVSQALLWLDGRTVQNQPLAARVPWPEPDWSLSPLGYRPAAVAGSIVPTYPPGLPLMMAGAAVVAGHAAVFWIVPLLGAAAVWLTFLLGRREAGAASGATAAVLLAASPVFLYQLLQPMSDVPVTAWWLASILAVAHGRPGLAGSCAAVAVGVRPNLAPLAAWLLAGVLGTRAGATQTRRLRAAAAFGAPIAVALGLLGVLHWHWYGHPLATGYGAAGDLFAAANVPVNIGHYLRWLVDTQTPLVLLSVAAPVLGWLRRSPLSARAPAPSPVQATLEAAAVSTDAGTAAGVPDGALMRPSFAWFGLGFAAFVLGLYLPYAPFAEWSYLRFLLPALPVLLILLAGVLLRLIETLPTAARAPILLLGLAFLAGRYLATANDRETFDLRRIESRYQAAGGYAARKVPAAAVLFSVQESGALRLYGGRTTLRFDHIDPRGLDAAVSFLQSAGYQPCFALEAWEEPQFRDRFAGVSDLGLLDWPPFAEVGSPVKVRFYDPRDREKYLAGHVIRTDRGFPVRGEAAPRR